MLAEAVEECRRLNQPVKLHLGCGNRLFEGYINIDGEYMRGTPGVIIHDITKPLPLPDNCVDEILTVHVIEHISRSLVLPMFKDWCRVCRPGGIAVNEWPDMLKMCREIVNNPSCFWSDDRRLLKRTILGIYGDNERYPDIAMMHKWGYSEDSMSRLFKNAGFTNTQSESNLHSKTNNDSRIVAYK